MNIQKFGVFELKGRKYIVMKVGFSNSSSEQCFPTDRILAVSWLGREGCQ
jgi:hypothetical protein